MKSNLKMALVSAVLALLCGCASVRVSRIGKTMVDAEISGWYLFSFIPIASGNPAKPNKVRCKMFSSTADVENNLKLIEYAMAQEGAVAVREVTSYTTDEHVLIFLLKRHSVHTSAELLLPTDELKSEAVSVVIEPPLAEEDSPTEPDCAQ